jgi:hypothetical protein
VAQPTRKRLVKTINARNFFIFLPVSKKVKSANSVKKAQSHKLQLFSQNCTPSYRKLSLLQAQSRTLKSKDGYGDEPMRVEGYP